MEQTLTKGNKTRRLSFSPSISYETYLIWGYTPLVWKVKGEQWSPR